MITKAIIEEVIDQYSVRIRAPYLNKVASVPGATAFEDLAIASICTIPGGNMNYHVGDIVFVEFENHQAARPVVMGQLHRESAGTQYAELPVSSLTVTVDAQLPFETTIGEVTADELQNLKGLNKNLQLQLDILTQRIAKLEEQINKG